MSDGANGLLGWVSNNWNKPVQGIAALTAALFSFFQPPRRMWRWGMPG